jgi:hypothetical protein
MEIIYFGNFSSLVQLSTSNTGFWLKETYTIRYLPFQHTKGTIYIMETEIYNEIQKEKASFPLYVTPFLFLEWRVPIYEDTHSYFLLKLNDALLYNYYILIYLLFPFDLRELVFHTFLKIGIHQYDKKEISNPFYYNKKLLKTIIESKILDWL